MKKKNSVYVSFFSKYRPSTLYLLVEFADGSIPVDSNRDVNDKLYANAVAHEHVCSVAHRKRIKHPDEISDALQARKCECLEFTVF